ncbi:hypothetical protein EZV62_015014 [Acer yangbiense]|uniref:Reverse transcriptase Ty1/copia-type domain-containing protein n=1 Tax=Acer yangbiense TaxID=1000413 RepID=A0A5C7HTN8_9ROSI|nr:hypothetical protein EZV62_028036 [Acer yangbiense]TXG60441.1 hypothetical protein EZV62_015014 [Acer yangbiense]
MFNSGTVFQQSNTNNNPSIEVPKREVSLTLDPSSTQAEPPIVTIDPPLQRSTRENKGQAPDRLSPMATISSPMATISSPNSYSQAKHFSHWQIAMNEELKALIKNHTWNIVPCPPKYDIIISRTDTFGIKQRHVALHSSFHMKDLGSLTYFLGLEVSRSDQGILVNQHKYTNDLIALAGLENSTPVDTPLEINVKYSQAALQRVALSSIVTLLFAVLTNQGSVDIVVLVTIKIVSTSIKSRSTLIVFVLKLILLLELIPRPWLIKLSSRNN